MEHTEFIDLVHERLGGARDVAERATRATLETLGQRLPEGEAEDLASQLAPPLSDYLHQTAAQGEEFPLDEFYLRVAELGELPPDEAEGMARAVLAILDEAVSSGQMTELIGALPGDYGDLLAETGTSGTG